jgi:hypothetical protein
MWRLVRRPFHRSLVVPFTMKREQVVYFWWNTFDQVLVPPNCLTILDRLVVPAAAGKTSLVTAGGKPDRNTACEHLPMISS